MKKTGLLIVILLAYVSTTLAQEKLYIHKSDKVTLGTLISSLDSIKFGTDVSTISFNLTDTIPEFILSEIDSLSFGNDSQVVEITYSDNSVSIRNPLAFEGVSVKLEGGDVIVTSVTDKEVEYMLSGTTGDGSFKLYSDKKFILTLNGVDITNSDGPAINIQSGKKATVKLVDGTINTLTDGANYTAFEKEDMKATFFSEGQLIFSGNGTLNVYGNYKHAICSDDYIQIQSGTINVPASASDGIHANDYVQVDGGILTISATGDGIDGDAGYIVINGGEINITVVTDSNKGIKCDGTITMNDGTIRINTSGNVVVKNNDPSYCTAVKCNGNLTINGGSLTIVSTGIAGKGISVDGDVIINNGYVDITTSGNGDTYTNTSNEKDSYSATCIKSDLNILILDGTVITKSSGTAGKCISADGTLTIGDATHVPVISATTTGAKFYVSGSGNNADYANPKAIKSEGDLTVHNGLITVRTSQDGGEGLESKATLTINDGTLDIQTYDDALNASTNITINGGQIYCQSSGNDGIDSNGTLTITGGIVIAVGTNSPEAGFDCDNSTFKITGGTIIGIGGSTSTPTSNVCTQRSIIYSGTGTANQLIHIRSAAGDEVITFKMPRSYSQSMTMLVSSAAIASNTSYSIYTGGGVSGGTDFQGLYTGSSYTPGTVAKTFTSSSSSMVTNTGNSGGPGGRP